MCDTIATTHVLVSDMLYVYHQGTMYEHVCALALARHDEKMSAAGSRRLRTMHTRVTADGVLYYLLMQLPIGNAAHECQHPRHAPNCLMQHSKLNVRYTSLRAIARR